MDFFYNFHKDFPNVDILLFALFLSLLSVHTHTHTHTHTNTFSESFKSIKTWCYFICKYFRAHFLKTRNILQSQHSSVQSLSHIWLFMTPWTAACKGLPVHHQLPEFAQTHVHQVCDAIQPFHPLRSPSPPAFNLSQHQGLFHGVSSSHQVAKVL